MGDDVVSPKGFSKDDIRNGKFRGRSATKVSENMLRSRWSKTEILRLKRLGLTFEASLDRSF
jgi:hypothetical protein